MEYFDVLDGNGKPTGVRKERGAVHRDGDLHGGSHVWVIRVSPPDAPGCGADVLLQKRKSDKESFPGCLDVSCAGHVRAGETFLEAAVRELQEELGLSAKAEDLIWLHDQRVDGEYVFQGQPFKNHEFNSVYLLRPDFPLEGLTFLEEEIEGLFWEDVSLVKDECVSEGYTEEHGGKYCILPSEAEHLCRYLEDQGLLRKEGRADA